MPVHPALNPRIKDAASGLILAGKFTKDPNALPRQIVDMAQEERFESCLGIDEAILPNFRESTFLPITAIVDGELVLSEKALEEARDHAYEHNYEEIALAARSLLTELSMRTRPNPALATEDRPVVKRPAVVMNDCVSWPSFGTVMRGRVEVVHVSGTIKPHKEHPGIVATRDNPVATIRVYDQEKNGFIPSDRKITRPVNRLTKIAALPRPKGSNVFEIRNKGKMAELLIYSDIGADMWGGLSAKEFREQLNEVKNVDELVVRINSGGGDAFEGAAIYNTLREFKAHKVVHIDGLAASIATVIACAGDVINMAEASEYMIHRAWTLSMGNRNDLTKAIERLDLTDKIIAQVYANRTGQSETDLLKMMDEETWFSPAEAKEYGFIDEIVGTQSVAASIHRSWFKKGPNVVDFDAAERSRRLKLARGSLRAAGR
jgi:ATP-dependent Clp protease, protease subunit